MTFGLKNSSAIYQRSMTTLFHNIMHTLMKYYVDDLLTKSLTCHDRLKFLDKIFKRLEEYKVHLNPMKYVFGITS
jgi:hypothetical protein